MTDANDLRDKPRKIEALFAGAGTPGERDINPSISIFVFLIDGVERV